MKYKQLRIIGTSHIAKESLEEIQLAFQEHKPAIVAVELDRKRLHGLLSEQKSKISLSDVGRIGVKGYLFAVLGGWLQRKLGSTVGVMPGSEMKLAVEMARTVGAKIALIDQDIEITLRKFSQRLTWREKFRFMADMFKSAFMKKRMMKQMGLSAEQLDLSKVPSKELVRKLIAHLAERYPNVYDVLVAQRNKVMANNLSKLMHKYPDEPILAVVGAGHEEDMLEMIKKRMEGKVEVVR